MDGPTYDRVSFLRAASDAVAVVRVGPVIARELNDPEKVEGEPALPVVIYQVTVERADPEGPPAGSRLNLMYFDLDQMRFEGATPLRSGQRLVMFLRYRSNGAPGIESVGSFYVPVGQDQGLFDLSGDGTAVARSDIVRTLDGELDPQYRDNRLITTADSLLTTSPAAMPTPPR